MINRVIYASGKKCKFVLKYTYRKRDFMQIFLDSFRQMLMGVNFKLLI